MSLRVWLPLNGDLKNQGLDDVDIAAVGNITYTSGKIGQAATFPNAANSYIHMPGFKLQEGSWAAWIKISGEGSGTFQYIMSEGRDTGSIGTNIYSSKTGTTLHITTHEKTLNFSVNLNEWFHVVLVYGNEKISLYKNGSLINNTIYTEDSNYGQSNNRFVLGKMAYSYTSTGNYFPFNGQLNDVRIYDHCLSPKEVKLLAQGLVCHYPLNNNGQGNWNLLTGTKDFNGWYSNFSSWTVEDGVYKFPGNSSNAWIALNSPAINIEDIRGKDITISYEYRSDEDIPDGSYPSVNTYLKTTGPQATNYTTRIKAHNIGTVPTATDKQWHKIVHTIKNVTESSFSYISSDQSEAPWFALCIWFYMKKSCEFRHFKVEFGDKATPWCVAQSEAPDDIVYDTSGYCFNGIAKGTLTTSSDTPRYNISTYFGSGNNSIDIGLASIRPKDAITVSMWIKYTAWGNPISCTEGGGWNFENGSTGIRFPVYISGVGYKYTDSTVTYSSLSDNKWHMLTGTVDIDNIKFYVDGELKTTTAKGSTNGIGYNTSNHIHIGAEAAGGENIASAAYVGSISDVRIYCTALSAEDILELYNTGASIDNDGNLYAAMIQES